MRGGTMVWLRLQALRGVLTVSVTPGRLGRRRCACHQTNIIGHIRHISNRTAWVTANIQHRFWVFAVPEPSAEPLNATRAYVAGATQIQYNDSITIYV